MAARKPRIEYYWTLRGHLPEDPEPMTVRVNWRLVGANGEIMCQSTQGFRDKADARRSVMAVSDALQPSGNLDIWARETGPGRRPA